MVNDDATTQQFERGFRVPDSMVLNVRQALRALIVRRTCFDRKFRAP
jgi:hypothetical protein